MDGGFPGGMVLRERLTARVVLLDEVGRVLLMKGRLPSAPDARGAWFTIGGGVEPGESIEAAAAREIVEETGFDDAVLGPTIWRRASVLKLSAGEPVLFQEHYVLARCAGREPSREGWNALERRLIDDIRWWTPADLAACEDDVYPTGLAGLISTLDAGAATASLAGGPVWID
jgi:8-oxo-dGTP pyrophosphatase MutT (NUDIX family)